MKSINHTFTSRDLYSLQATPFILFFPTFSLSFLSYFCKYLGENRVRKELKVSLTLMNN